MISNRKKKDPFIKLRKKRITQDSLKAKKKNDFKRDIDMSSDDKIILDNRYH